MLYKKNCKVCGKEFESKMPFAKYCCEKCGKKVWGKDFRDRHRVVKTAEATCPQCGKEFIKNNPKQIYCSKNCNTRHYQEKQRENLKVTCRLCGKEFPKFGNFKYCEICRNKSRYTLYTKPKKEQIKRIEKPKIVHGQCKQCGKDLYRKERMYCSRECRLTYCDEHRKTKPCPYCGQPIQTSVKNGCAVCIKRHKFHKVVEEGLYTREEIQNNLSNGLKYCLIHKTFHKICCAKCTTEKLEKINVKFKECQVCGQNNMLKKSSRTVCKSCLDLRFETGLNYPVLKKLLEDGKNREEIKAMVQQE